MDKKKTRAIVVGGGANSAVGRVHREALKMANVEVIDGFFSRDKDVDKVTRVEWGLREEQNENIEKLCERNKSSKNNNTVAIVLTPTTNHYKDIMYLLEQEFNVICEKPMGVSRKEVSEIMNKATEKDRIVRCTYNYGGYPMLRELAELVKAGRIGRVRQLKLEMPQEGLVKPPNIAGKRKPPQAWRLKDPAETSMANLDLGAHLYQIGRMVCGERIDIVASCMDNFTRYDNIEDTTYAIIKTPSGAKGMFWITKSMLGMRNGLSVSICGEKGTVKWTQTDSEKLIFSSSEILEMTLDRGSRCLEANNVRYERMKPGHPSGYIEAFANTYIDIVDEIYKWQQTGNKTSKYGLDIETSLEIAEFLEDLKLRRQE